MATPIYDAVKALLVERAWTLDETAREDPFGELHEFVHPETGERYEWIDALHAQADREAGVPPTRGAAPDWTGPGDPDDHERASCEKAGHFGHYMCGRCPEHRVPRFRCGCLAVTERTTAAGLRVRLVEHADQTVRRLRELPGFEDAVDDAAASGGYDRIALEVLGEYVAVPTPSRVEPGLLVALLRGTTDGHK